MISTKSVLAKTPRWHSGPCQDLTVSGIHIHTSSFWAPHLPRTETVSEQRLFGCGLCHVVLHCCGKLICMLAIKFIFPPCFPLMNLYLVAFSLMGISDQTQMLQ